MSLIPKCSNCGWAYDNCHCLLPADERVTAAPAPQCSQCLDTGFVRDAVNELVLCPLCCPAPQAEGTSDLRGTCDNKHPSSTYPHRQAVDCVNWRVGAAPAETAGEMTAEQFVLASGFRQGSPVSYKAFLQVAESFAKQRMEQVERLVQEYKDVSGDLTPQDLEKLLDKTASNMGIGDLGDIAEYAHRTELAEAKVADLERERRNLKGAVNLLTTRAEAAESELREMREALDHTLFCMNRSCKYCRDLLARKAGS